VKRALWLAPARTPHLVAHATRVAPVAPCCTAVSASPPPATTTHAGDVSSNPRRASPGRGDLSGAACGAPRRRGRTRRRSTHDEVSEAARRPGWRATRAVLPSPRSPALATLSRTGEGGRYSSGSVEKDRGWPALAAESLPPRRRGRVASVALLLSFANAAATQAPRRCAVIITARLGSRLCGTPFGYRDDELARREVSLIFDDLIEARPRSLPRADGGLRPHLCARRGDDLAHPRSRASQPGARPHRIPKEGDASDSSLIYR
jgi:hypothetical protein